MAKDKYKIRPGYMLKKVRERSKNYLGQLGNAELIEALENTKIEHTRTDRYTALLFAADTLEIAAIRILGEVINRVDRTSRLKDFRYRTGDIESQNVIETDERSKEKRKGRITLKIAELES